ncbi:MAG: hypothetical protein Q9202_006922 [Teloschistes flavicans]
MHLIDTSTLTIHEFNEVNIPAYAILSHTWGEEEISFQNFEKPSSRTLTGYIKITRCCEIARSDGWQYVWVDTCCIDKTSSAELSEAINSMYRWYKEAQVCYVYMVDLTGMRKNDFMASRWFQRGWTLQELLAPDIVIFYDSNWEEVGTKSSLEKFVSHATRIAREHLAHPTLASVAAKMSWAASRKTTRAEDIAYCLMGLFDVNMPLLYGEGQKAFQRLQEMILQKTCDESIFAFNDPFAFSIGPFAQSPDAFAESGDISPRSFSRLYRRPTVMTNMGLEIEIHELPDSSRQHRDEDQILLLNCRRASVDEPLMIRLEHRSEDSYVRLEATTLETWSSLNVGIGEARPFSSRRIYIVMLYPPKNPLFAIQPEYLLLKLAPSQHGFSLISAAEDVFGHSIPFESQPRQDLGGWTIAYHLDMMVSKTFTFFFFFRHSGGESFKLRLDRGGNIPFPTIQMKVPRKSPSSDDTKTTAISFKATRGMRAGADRLKRTLQAGTLVSCSVRKKLLNGDIFYVVEINISPRPNESLPPPPPPPTTNGLIKDLPMRPSTRVQDDQTVLP